MAPLNDNSVLTRGTSFSWIFVADGSGGFDSRPIDQNAPKASEAARHQEIDDFIDQLEEVKLPVDGEARNQPDFDAISPKTLSKMEGNLDKLLEDTKQETIVDGKILSSGCHQDIIQVEQPVNTVSMTTIENYLKDLMKIRPSLQ
jgi:hypothetical protein